MSTYQYIMYLLAMMVITTILQSISIDAVTTSPTIYTKHRKPVVAGGGFSSILESGGSYKDDTPDYLPGAAVVNVNGTWAIICMMALAIYSVLFYVFSYNIWHAVKSVGDAWGARSWQRRVMATLSVIQAALGFGVMLWILIGFFRLTRNRQADGLVIVIGQRTSMQLISVMQLLKAYHINNRSKTILVIGSFLVLASLAMTGVKCSTIPPPSMQWGYYAVEIAAYLGMGLAIILELILNLFVNICFLVVIHRHNRNAKSSLYSVLLRDGIIFTMVCTITSIFIATLFLTKAIRDNILSIVYHISWALQSWLMIQQLESAQRNRTATTAIRPARGVSHSPTSPIRHTPVASPRNNSKYSDMTRYSNSTANRERSGVLAPATNIRYDSPHYSTSTKMNSPHYNTSTKVNSRHVSCITSVGHLSSCQSPIGTYSPHGVQGMAIPQHHAKSPVKPSLRSPLFMTETARKQQTVSFASDDKHSNSMQRYPPSLLNERSGNPMEINTGLQNSTSNQLTVNINKPARTGTSNEQTSPTSSLIICDTVDIDDSVDFTMTTEQTFSFHDYPVSDGATKVISPEHLPSKNNSSSTVNSICSQQTSNESQPASVMLDEIIECYQTTQADSKNRLPY